MKKTPYLLLFILCSITQFSLAQKVDIEKQKQLLVGYWMIEDKGILVIEANGDIRVETNGEVVNSGTWELDEAGTIFSILEDGNLEETMRITTLNEKEFSFNPSIDSDEIVTLLRTDENSIKMPDDMDITGGETEETVYGLTTEAIDERKKFLVGIWVIQGESTLIISEDGTIKEVEGGSVQNTGTWDLDVNGTTFLIYEDGEIEEEINIIEVTKDIFRVKTPDGKIITLNKEKTLSTSEIKERQKLLIGAWELNTIDVSAVENPESSLIIEIKKDGSFKSSKGNDFDKSGTWTMSKDGHYLNISAKGDSEQKSRIISVDEYELVLLTGSKTTSFMRIK